MKEFISTDDKILLHEAKIVSFLVENNLPFTIAPKLVNLAQNLCMWPETLKKVILNRQKAKDFLMNCLGPVFQSQLLEVLKHTFFSLYIDTTTDINTKYQLAIVVKYFQSEKVQTALFKLLNLSDERAETICLAIKDNLLNIPELKAKMIGVFTDGAKNMVGEFTGLRGLLKKEKPSLFFGRCLSHALHLVAEKSYQIIPDIIQNFIEQVTHYFSKSAKKNSLIFKTAKGYGRKSPNYSQIL